MKEDGLQINTQFVKAVSVLQNQTIKYPQNIFLTFFFGKFRNLPKIENFQNGVKLHIEWICFASIRLKIEIRI
jgi:hypothetical protein